MKFHFICTILQYFFSTILSLSSITKSGSQLSWAPGEDYVLSTRMSSSELCFLYKLSLQSNVSAIEMKRYERLGTSSNCTTSLPEAYTSLKSVYCPIGVERYDCFRSHMPALRLKNGTSCGISAPDRLSFWSSYWENLSPPLYGDNHAVSLLQILKQRDIVHFRFVGDSIAGQIRTNLQSMWSRYSKEENIPFVNSESYLPCGLDKVGVGARTPYACFTPNKTLCTDINQALFITKILLKHIPNVDLQNFTKTSTGSTFPRTIVIFHPFGTHIWNTPNDRSRAKGIAMGIIDAGKRIKEFNGTLLILESPAQHFVYDIGHGDIHMSDTGNYSGVFQHKLGCSYKKYNPGSCCGKTINSPEGNFRNIDLLRELNALDPLWTTYVGWIIFYEPTQIVDNGNIEHNCDCTHFAWTPFFYDPIWKSFENEITRLLP
eukprot:gene8060-16528_t